MTKESQRNNADTARVRVGERREKTDLWICLTPQHEFWSFFMWDEGKSDFQQGWRFDPLAKKGFGAFPHQNYRRNTAFYFSSSKIKPLAL